MKKFLYTLLLFPLILFAVEDADYIQALNLYKQKEYWKSIEAIRKIIDEKGTSYELHYLAAHNYWRLKNHRVAKQHFDQAVEKDNSNKPNLYIDLSKFLLDYDRPKSALKTCKEGLEKFPDNLDLNLLKASIYADKKQMEKALKIVEKLKVQYPENYEPIAMEAYIYFENGKLEKAEMSLKWAITLSPNNHNLENNLGLIYEKLAIQSLKKSRKLEKQGKNDLANTYKKQGLKYLDDAINEVKKASEREPENEVYATNLKRIKSFKNSL